MAMAFSNSLVLSKSFVPTHFPLPSSKHNNQCSFSRRSRPTHAVHVADNPTVFDKQKPSRKGKWVVDNWKSKKVLQLREYLDQEKLDWVFKTLEVFPPIVFAGEARNLEERLKEVAMEDAFLLQGGDYVESFKEKNGMKVVWFCCWGALRTPCNEKEIMFGLLFARG